MKVNKIANRCHARKEAVILFSVFLNSSHEADRLPVIARYLQGRLPILRDRKIYQLRCGNIIWFNQHIPTTSAAR
jgi:hypothetical protein